MGSKDEKNLKQVLEKNREVRRAPTQCDASDAPRHSCCGARTKPRIWYGMPAYAKSAGSPVLLSLRNDDLMNLGITEKAAIAPAGGRDGLLSPSAWYFDDLDEVTEKRIGEIVRTAAQ